MSIALITKSKKKQINLKLYDKDLKELIEEEFQDLYTLNFFLQTIPKKYNINKTLIIFNDLDKLNYNNDNNQNNNNTIELILAEEENEYFISNK
ncbi:MAG: hypothetical protein ABJB76_12675 [Candidatus Nitrosocosmicus sp.]